MAKARTIDDIVNDIVIKKYKPLLQEAVEHVAKQAEDYIYNKARNVLIKYYYGGYDPKSYYRTGALLQSIIPDSKVKTIGSGKNEMIECTVSVEYSAKALEQYWGSFEEYSYLDPGMYDKVIENFLAGKHPTTDGSTDSEQAKASFQLINSRPMVTQYEGMRLNEPGDTGYGLKYYQHTIFPKAVMNYIIVKGSK